MHEDELGTEVVRAAIEVHKALGPGLLESAYRFCMTHELLERGIPTEAEVRLPIQYKGLEMEEGYRLDLWLERKLIVELKAVEALNPVHQAQLLTYLKLTENKVGYLINFHNERAMDGVKRMVNGF